MSDKETKEASDESLDDSRPKRQRPDEMSDSPEPVTEAGDSPKQVTGVFSRNQTGNLPDEVESAVGVEVQNPEKQIRDKKIIEELNKRASSLDKKGLQPGKLDVFRKYFDEEELEFYTVPENRRRHRAERQRLPESDQLPPNIAPPDENNPLGHLQEQDPRAILNQAGAIVGISPPGVEFRNLRGLDGPLLPEFRGVCDPEHSYVSAETVPIGEIYAGNFSPKPSPSVSSRGVSPGSSFPSFPSRPETASDFYEPKISPLPDSVLIERGRQGSPLSTDSESLPAPEKPVRRRRFGVSQPISIPSKNKSGIEGSSGEQKQFRHKDSTSIPRRKISKESTDSLERVSSEDEVPTYPELSHSVESDQCLPMPDLIQSAAENLQQSLGALRTSAGMGPEGAQSSATVQNPVRTTDESDSEQDPVSVLSVSPFGCKDLEQQPQ